MTDARKTEHRSQSAAATAVLALIVFFVAFFSTGFFGGAPAAAQSEGMLRVGSGSSAMPALGRVLVASETEAGIDAAAFAGWAYTEDVLGTSDQHHRAFGSVSLAGRPIQWLTLGGRLDGRWDHHLALGNDDDSAVGESRVFVRGDVNVTRDLALGLTAIVFVPGGDAPSLAFEATTLDLRALASYTPDGMGLTLALDVGWRFDGSGRAVSRPIAFGRADLVSLGASDSDSLLLGFGGAYRIDESELFAEVTSELLVEHDLAASPVRVAAGARLPLVSRLLHFAATAEVGVGGRAPVDPESALIPVEPRFALSIGLVLSPRSAPPVVVDEEPPPDDLVIDDVDPVPDEDVTPGVTTVRGRVLDPSGSPLAGATVSVASAPELTTSTAVDGTYTLEGVPDGAELTLRADGYAETTIALGAAGDTVLERALPSGALRGLVRSHSGRDVTATIRVEPGDATAETDADGAFEIALTPGRYTVTIEAPGHESQRRSIEVELGGVTVLNVDLRRRR